jgi:PKD repeat protein
MISRGLIPVWVFPITILFCLLCMGAMVPIIPNLPIFSTQTTFVTVSPTFLTPDLQNTQSLIDQGETQTSQAQTQTSQAQQQVQTSQAQTQTSQAQQLQTGQAQTQTSQAQELLISQAQTQTSQAQTQVSLAQTSQAQTLTSQPLPPPPIAKALTDKAGGMAPLTINFLGNRSEGTITTFVWDFGDGGNSNETNPVHVFRRSGIYGSQLTVSGAGGNSQTKVPVVVAPQSTTPLSLSVWVTSNDFDDFDLNAKTDWINTFPPGSEIFFRDMTDLIIPYIKNDAPLAAGHPDVLYLSSETMLRLDDLFFQGYRVYVSGSGDQPPPLAIFAFPDLIPLINEYVISYPIDQTKFAQHDGVVYGIPYKNGYLVPIASESNNKIVQAFSFSMWMHLTQAGK